MDSDVATDALADVNKITRLSYSSYFCADFPCPAVWMLPSGEALEKILAREIHLFTP